MLEDDPAFAALVQHVIRQEGGEPTHCDTIAAATAALARRRFDVILLDNHLPDGKAYDFFREFSRRNPEAPVIMITGLPDLDEAISLTRNGLFDYLGKPLDADALSACLRRALLRIGRPEPRDEGAPWLGESPSMREVAQQLREAAQHQEAVVLLTGESGVGKDVVARALHAWTFGDRAAQAPYVPVNCAAVPAEMFEAELFGAERGAYTGADRRRAGLVASAQDGTLFLDEIGEVPLALQAKLLRFLENREYRALGSTELRTFRGRLVTATNQDLHAAVQAGRFRQDLLYRIEVFATAIPPLRERREDIPGLAERLLAQLAAKYGRPVPLLQAADSAALQRHSFPGNVRELRNILERSLLRTPMNHPWLVLAHAGFLGATPASNSSPVPAATSAPGFAPPPAPALPTPPPPAPNVAEPLPPERADLTPVLEQEYRLIRTTLRETNGGIRRAAAKLGLSPQALLRRLEKWPELRPPQT